MIFFSRLIKIRESGLPAISVLSSPSPPSPRRPPQLLYGLPLSFTGATHTAAAEAGKALSESDDDRSNNRSGARAKGERDRASDGGASASVVVVRAPRPSPQHPLTAMTDCRPRARLGRGEGRSSLSWGRERGARLLALNTRQRRWLSRVVSPHDNRAVA